MPVRAHLEEKARRGDADAIAKLEGPEVPLGLRYLHGWFYELHHARTYDMNGMQGFSYPMIESWARLSGRTPSPGEVDALLVLDRAWRFPHPTPTVAVVAHTISGESAPARDAKFAWPSRPPIASGAIATSEYV